MPSVCDGPEGLMMSSDSSLACASHHIQNCQISANSSGRGGDFLDVFLFVLESHALQHLIKMNSNEFRMFTVHLHSR